MRLPGCQTINVAERESAIFLFLTVRGCPQMTAKQSEWRNAKHRLQWRVTLETYCAPIWAMPVDEVATEAVLGVLRPLWQARPETASRLRGRIEAVLDAAGVAISTSFCRSEGSSHAGIMPRCPIPRFRPS
jgi:hypothetical protein